MKIAVPVMKDGQIDGHFGHCEFYKIFTISEQNQIQEVLTINSPQGCGCKSDIAYTLAENGVKLMLAGGIGNGAINVLNSQGINVVRGCAGNAAEVVSQYFAGLITDNGKSCNHHELGLHHDRGDGHVCSN